MGGYFEGFELGVGPSEGLVEDAAGVLAVFGAASDAVEVISEAAEGGMDGGC